MSKETPAQKAAAEEALEAFDQFAELGPGVQVQISRMPGGAYLEIVALDVLDMELMRARYGGGTFALRARSDGKFIKGSPTRTVVIEGASKVFPTPIVESTTATEVARLQGEIAKLQAPSGAPSSDAVMVTMMTTMGTLLTTVLTASLERSPERSSLDTALQIVDVVRKLGKDQKRDGGDLDPVRDLGIPLLEEIRDMRGHNRRMEADPPLRLNPAPADGAPNGSPPKVPKTTHELASFLARYCAPHARADKDPDVRAYVLMEDLEVANPPLFQAVGKLSMVAGVLGHWERICPEIANTREWHAEFIEAVRLVVTGDELQADDAHGDEEAPPRRHGDEGDPPGYDRAVEVGGPE